MEIDNKPSLNTRGHIQNKIAARIPFFYGWLILPVILAIQVASSPGQTFGVSIFNPYIRAELGLSHSEISGTYMLGTLLASLPMVYVGSLMDRYGPRRRFESLVPERDHTRRIRCYRKGYIGIQLSRQKGHICCSPNTPSGCHRD